VRAGSPEEAVEALTEYGDSARPLAGGQSLLAMMSLRVAQPEILIDLGPAGLDAIAVGDGLEVGSMATQNAALFSSEVAERAPLITRALKDVSHHTLRNRGTIGGSVAHADPAAELPAVLLALDAELVVLGKDGARTVPADDFFVSHFATALADDELLTAIRFKRTKREEFAFHEIARRHGDFALAGMASSFELTESGEVADARIALFAVDARPMRVPDAEAAIRGRALGDADAIAEAGAAARAVVDPTGDIHGSASYRKRMTEVTVRRGLQDAARRLSG